MFWGRSIAIVLLCRSQFRSFRSWQHKFCFDQHWLQRAFTRMRKRHCGPKQYGRAQAEIFVKLFLGFLLKTNAGWQPQYQLSVRAQEIAAIFKLAWWDIWLSGDWHRKFCDLRPLAAQAQSVKNTTKFNFYNAGLGNESRYLATSSSSNAHNFEVSIYAIGQSVPSMNGPGIVLEI